MTLLRFSSRVASEECTSTNRLILGTETRWLEDIGDRVVFNLYSCIVWILDCINLLSMQGTNQF